MLRNDFQEMILKHFGSLIVEEKNNEIVFDKFLFENYGVIITKDIKEISDLEEIFKRVYKNDNIDKTLFSLNQIFNLSEEEKAYHTVMHYFTTYGKELLQLITGNKFESNFIYIPKNLDINSKPMLTKASEDSVAVRLVIGITLDELKEKIFKIFDVDTGLNKDFIIDMAYLIKNLFKEDFIELVKKDVKVINREFFSACLSACDIIPKNPELFIKSILLKENKIMIRNKATFETLVTKSEKLKEYLDLYGYKEISKNWHRLRKYFLVMKKNLPKKEYKKMINRARKEAKKLNKPFRLSPVNNVLMVKPDLKIFTNAIKKTNIYQLVKVYNYLNKTLNSCASHLLYKIRNGKVWIKEKSRMDESTKITEYILAIEQEIIDRQIFKDKVFYIPSNIQYTFPTSSKQTIGGIPYGSQIIFDSTNIAIGIQWNNSDKYGRIDLDLHYRNIDGVSVSWDTQYTLNGDIYFTGDVTDAEDGACELMLVKIPTIIKSILTANYFNCPSNYQNDLEYNFVVIDSNKKFNDIDMKEVYDPMEVGNILVNKELTMINNNMTLGLMTGKRFIFGSYSIGHVRTSNLKVNINELLIQTIYDSTEYSMTFDKFIELSGGKVIRNVEEIVIDREYEKMENGNYAMVKEVEKQNKLKLDDIIDLSLKNISSNTFFDLIG